MTKDSGGYQDNPFVAQVYDQVIPYRERPDVKFFVQEAVGCGGAVLEIGCGTGRVLLPTARSGVSITGLDLSPYMLDVCRKKLKAEPQPVKERVLLIEGDMREFNLGRTFALISIPFRAFQHLLTVNDQLRCLDCIRRHLAPDGIFILDIFNPSLKAITADNLGKEVEAGPEFTTPEGIKVRRFNKTKARDHHKQLLDVELVYYLTYPDGREERIVHAFLLRYLFRFEAEHLLMRAGFNVVDLFAGYNQESYGSIYPGELVFRAALSPRHKIEGVAA